MKEKDKNDKMNENVRDVSKKQKNIRQNKMN